jgi:flavin-dependent dehydrogenase
VKSVKSLKSVVNTSPIIVGASISGLTAAYYLARAGVPARLFEAQAPFQPAERTLIVTPAWLRLLEGTPDEVVLNRIAAFELISAGASARIPLREPDVVIERARFLQWLVQRVREAGGEVLFGHRLTAIHPGRTHLILRFTTGENRERWVPTFRVLGADGVHSAVARAIGEDGLERVGLAQARVPLPPDLPPDTVRVWFDRATTRFFYWLIPESPQTAAAGVIAENPGEARRRLEDFLRGHGLSPLGWQEEAEVPLFPLQAGRAPLGNGRVLLAGDAAGQVKVTTVGGVVTGMRGGLAAARSLLHHTFYDAELRSLRGELFTHALVRRVLDSFTDEDYDELLGLLNGRTLALLGRYHRDELARALWQSLLSQPGWLFLGARALVRSLSGGNDHCQDARPLRGQERGGR